MSSRDEQAIKERCTNISSNSRWIDILVGKYYDKNPSTKANIVEVNRIRKEVVNQPNYIRSVAIEQLRQEGVLAVEH